MAKSMAKYISFHYGVQQPLATLILLRTSPELCTRSYPTLGGQSETVVTRSPIGLYLELMCNIAPLRFPIFTMHGAWTSFACGHTVR